MSHGIVEPKAMTKIEVSGQQLNHILPSHLIPYLIELEAKTQQYLRDHSKDYTGGLWNYYRLTDSKTAFFLAPTCRKSYLLEIHSNYFSALVDAEAAGIIAFTHALNSIISKQASNPDQTLLHMYYHVMHYGVTNNPYGSKIAVAID